MGGVSLTPCEEGTMSVWPEEGGKLILPIQTCADDWKDATHVVVELTGLDPFNPVLTMVFMGDNPQEPGTIMNVGAIPGIRVKVAFPLDYLDSNRMFVKRTPGRLKQIVMGLGMEKEEVQALILTTRKCHQKQNVIIHDIYFSYGEPEYSVNAEPLIDSMGQWKARDWSGKAASEEDMIRDLNETLNRNKEIKNEKWSKFGGDISVKWEGTGFFRTHFDGKRWYLADPEGYRFISTGLDCCGVNPCDLITGIECLHEELPDKEKFKECYEKVDVDHDPGIKDFDFINYAKVNLMKAFGEDWEEKWTSLIRNNMVDWNFNTIGNWSDLKFIKNAKLPYVWPLENFPDTSDHIFRDFPDVFSEEYQKNADVFAQQLKAFEKDPYMIGYFLRNEPNWAFVMGLLIAEKLLENPRHFACKDKFIEVLKEKYKDIAALNAAWNQNYDSFEDLQKPQVKPASFSEQAKEDITDFSKEMIRKFAEVPSLACRKVDADHMNLGMRYSSLADPLLLSGSEYFDVFSLNGYQESPYEEAHKAGELTGKPVIIGEFHFGAIDVGLPAGGIFTVAEQKDRGIFYRKYYEKGLASPYFVGAHYFTLYDEPTLGRFDGENMQIGVLDVCSHPYQDCIDKMRKANQDVYDIAEGKLEPSKEEVNRIPRLMGF